MDEDCSIPWEVVLTRFRLRWGDLVGQTRLGSSWLMGGERRTGECVFLDFPLPQRQAEQPLAFRVFLPVVVQQQVLWRYRLSPGPSSCVSLRWLLEDLLLFLHAWSTLGNVVPFFVAASCLAVLFPVSGCCSWSTGIGFFGRCCLSLGRNAWFDCEYMFCISTGRIAHIFFVERTRILRCFASFLRRMEKCARLMSQVAWNLEFAA